MRFRRFINRAHLWIGLIASLPVIVLSLTGMLLVYEDELTRWELGGVGYVEPHGARMPFQQALNAANRVYPDQAFIELALPEAPDHAVLIYSASGLVVGVDPYSGQVLGERREQRMVMYWIREMHETFFLGAAGRYITGLFSLLTAVLIIMGLYLWWKRSMRLRNKLTIKFSAKARRTNYDAHGTIGFFSSFFLLAIALSGVLIAFNDWWKPVILSATGTEWEQRPTLEVPRDPGEPIASIDRLLSVSDKALPAMKPARVYMPPTLTETVRVLYRFPEHRRPKGWTYLHPTSGKLLGTLDPAEFAAGRMIHRMNRGLHSGELFGEWMRTLWLILSIVPVVLVATGFFIWYRPRRTPKLRQ